MKIVGSDTSDFFVISRLDHRKFVNNLLAFKNNNYSMSISFYIKKVCAMKYTEKELWEIYDNMPLDEEKPSIVRGLLQVILLDRSFPIEVVNSSPEFTRYVQENTQQLKELFNKEKAKEIKIGALNKAIIRDALTQLSLRATITWNFEHRVIKLEILESSRIIKEWLTLKEIFSLISQITEDTNVKSSSIREEIREWIEEFHFSHTDEDRFHIKLLLSSIGELTGIVSHEVVDAMYFQGATFLVTKDLNTIVHILEKFGYQKDKVTIEESIGEYLDDITDRMVDEDDDEYDEGDD